MKIVILGGGTAGWMAAAALAQGLGSRNHEITLVESSEISTVGVGEATIPMIDVFNKIVGLTPFDIVQETKATIKLGIEFADWNRKGHSYFHPFGGYGQSMNGVSFTHYWLRQKASGKSPDLEPYSLETVAAWAGKFGSVAPKNPEAPRLNHAYHFDAGLYAQLLRKRSLAQGVIRIDSKVTQVRRNAETGDVNALLLEGGDEVSGDLFIDCSGFRALLIGQELGVEYINWSQYLPCDRAVVVASDVQETLPPYTRATARDAGWQWRIPLQHRTGNGYVYSSQFTTGDEAAEHFLSGLDRPVVGDPRMLKFTTGYRPRMWEKNVVSMGLSAGFLEPLESTSIFLVQSAITKLMHSLPRGKANASVRSIFNTSMNAEYERIRDFLIAHYSLTSREDTEFWRYCKNMKIPQTLSDYIALYEEEGFFYELSHDLFKEASWLSVLHGQGVTPKRYNPIADTADEAALDKQMNYLQSLVMQSLHELPDHNDFIKSCLEGSRV